MNDDIDWESEPVVDRRSKETLVACLDRVTNERDEALRRAEVAADDRNAIADLVEAIDGMMTNDKDGGAAILNAVFILFACEDALRRLAASR